MRPRSGPTVPVIGPNGAIGGEWDLEMPLLNETHDPARKSWVATANASDADFPIQNLPFGVFQTAGRTPRGGVAIGDKILDLSLALEAGVFSGLADQSARAASSHVLNPLFEESSQAVSALRNRLSDLLRLDGDESGRGRLESALSSIEEAELLRPFDVADYTDYSCSIHHISRLSRGRPWPALQYLPVGYNGRRSSVRLSGGEVRRPNGQSVFPLGSGGAPTFGPEPALDFELELGAVLGGSNALGEPLDVDAAAERLFGYCLLNDWSARSIQMFEAALGPLLGKSFHTSISPWLVTDEALAPFKIARPERTSDMPLVPAHLDSPANRAEGALDVTLEAYLLTPAMRQAGHAPARVVNSNFKHMHWTFAQMVAHQASGGCNLGPGDLVGSGTVSGPDDDAQACLMEKTMMTGVPITLPNDETRMWLQDGDEVILRGRAQREGFVPIGFGSCSGRISSAPTWAGPAT